ncbi:olfactory receptor 2K2-like [Aplochiton taeniatus]
MENRSMVPLKQPIVFELEGFVFPQSQGPLLFSLALLNFLVVLMGNGMVLSVIVTDRTLHRPMYVMVCNLAVCDLMGGTAVLVRLMIHFVTGDKRITYVSAIAQAFTVHTYGATVQTILSAMAYDRYIAVCEPLRYQAIMTSARLMFSLALAWAVAFLCIIVLFALNVGSPLCGTLIQHVYCSNRSILSLACGPTEINNIYGLVMSWSLSTGTFLIIAFSYAKILHACVKRNRDSGSRSKAIQTCASHLLIYCLYEIAAVVITLSQRFISVSQEVKKFGSILFVIIPPAINPIIYGLVTKELRTRIFRKFLSRATQENSQGPKSIQ